MTTDCTEAADRFRREIAQRLVVIRMDLLNNVAADGRSGYARLDIAGKLQDVIDSLTKHAEKPSPARVPDSYKPGHSGGFPF